MYFLLRGLGGVNRFHNSTVFKFGFPTYVADPLVYISFYELTIYILSHLTCIRLVSVRSSHLPFKMH